jgi:hypothetical protein
MTQCSRCKKDAIMELIIRYYWGDGDEDYDRYYICSGDCLMHFLKNEKWNYHHSVVIDDKDNKVYLEYEDILTLLKLF